MNTTHTMATVALIVGSGWALHVTPPQQPGIKRIELQRHDLGVSGLEVVQVRIDLRQGEVFGKHTHPGEEITYGVICTTPRNGPPSRLRRI
jgi:quercetin dioxygenase-like cupin family protein